MQQIASKERKVGSLHSLLLQHLDDLTSCLRRHYINISSSPITHTLHRPILVQIVPGNSTYILAAFTETLPLESQVTASPVD